MYIYKLSVLEAENSDLQRSERVHAQLKATRDIISSIRLIMTIVLFVLVVLLYIYIYTHTFMAPDASR